MQYKMEKTKVSYHVEELLQRYFTPRTPDRRLDKRSVIRQKQLKGKK